MVGDLRMWLGQALPGNPRKMRRPPTTFTERPDYPATPSCLAYDRMDGPDQTRRQSRIRQQPHGVRDADQLGAC